MNKIRVVLASMPAMLTEIIEDLVAGEDDMQVVAKAPQSSDVLCLARRLDARVVIVREDHGSPHDPGDELMASEKVRVLAIASDGKTGRLYRLQPRGEALGELSGEGLLAAVRAAAREPH